MKYLATFFLVIVTALAILVSVNGFMSKPTVPSQVFQILFIPITVYLFIGLTCRLTLQSAVFEPESALAKLLVVYCFIISTTFVLGGLMASKTQADFLTNLVFAPLPIYFLILVVPKKFGAKVLPVDEPTIISPPQRNGKIDENRRDFLKLIGAAGITLFAYNLLFRRDVSPLFGNSGNNASNPLTLKNSQGEVINPAEDSPTAGYSISQIDDSPTSYFGFINNLGQWFIMRQDTDNSYRYTKGDKDFSDNWQIRAKLDYDYFDNVF